MSTEAPVCRDCPASSDTNPEKHGDPMTFVHDFCHKNGLPTTPGETQTELECAIIASEAREEFKAWRLATERPNFLPSGPSTCSAVGHTRSELDKDNLSPSQKYNIRIRNNRKSAYASKVFAEVFKRALSRRLHDLTKGCPAETDKGDHELRLHFAAHEHHLKRALYHLRTELVQEKQDLARRKAEGDRMKLSILTICSRSFSARFVSPRRANEINMQLEPTLKPEDIPAGILPAGPPYGQKCIDNLGDLDRAPNTLSFSGQSIRNSPGQTLGEQDEIEPRR